MYLRIENRRFWTKFFVLVSCFFSFALHAQTSAEGGGKYLHADFTRLTKFEGSLTIRFAEPEKRVVIAYGRRYRKPLRKQRGTLDQERAYYKPFKARVQENGRVALFPHLPPDYYDLLVVQPREMVLLEGINLLAGSDAEPASDQTLDEIAASLGRQDDGRIAWQAFFEEKKFERGALKGKEAASFAQQMRPSGALTGGGSPVEGVIHSIDVVWLKRAMKEEKGWQVTVRQQLYRAAIDSDDFFKHKYTDALSGIRIVNSAKEIGPLRISQLLQNP